MSIAKKEQSYKEILFKNWLNYLFEMGMSDALKEKTSVGNYKIKSKCPFKKSNSKRKDYNSIFQKTVLANLLCLAIVKSKLQEFVKKVLEDCPVFELCRRDLNYDIPFQCKKNVSKNVSMCLADISMDDVKEIEFEEYCQSCPVKWLCEVLTYIESHENYTVDFLFDKYKEYYGVLRDGSYSSEKKDVDYSKLYNNHSDDEINFAIKLLEITKESMKKDIVEVKNVKSVFIQFWFLKYQELYLMSWDELFNKSQYGFRLSQQEKFEILEKLGKTIDEIEEQLKGEDWKEILDYIKNPENVFVNILFDKYKEYDGVLRDGSYSSKKYDVDYSKLNNHSDDERNFAIKLLESTKKSMKDIVEVKNVRSVFIQFCFLKYQELYLMSWDELFNKPQYGFRLSQQEKFEILEKLGKTIDEIEKQLKSEDRKEILDYIKNPENVFVNILFDKYREYDDVLRDGSYSFEKHDVDYSKLNNHSDDEINFAIKLLESTKESMEDIVEVKNVKSVFIQYYFLLYQRWYLMSGNELFDVVNTKEYQPLYEFRLPIEKENEIIESLRNTIPEINQEQLENLKDDEKKTWAEISEWYKKYKNIIEEQKKIDEYNNNPWHDIGYPVSALQEEKK